MATSMAAAVAASMPTTQVAPDPVRPTYEAIPASMSKVIDVEADIPVTSIQLDALVVTKIIKHSSESASQALGLLTGIDLDGTLEVSNACPLPPSAAVADDADGSGSGAGKSLARYQASLLRALNAVQADDAVVGVYQATPFGAFLRAPLLELQATHQEKLRQGGVVVVHDTTQASRGNAAFRAFKLTKNFLQAHKSGKFTTQSLIANSLTFSSVVEEIPVRIRTNPLTSAFLASLSTPGSVPPSPAAALSAPHRPDSRALPPTYTPLSLASALPAHLTRTLEALDEYRVEEGNLAFHARQIARERAKAEAHVAKRRDENTQRVAQGLPPLPEEDVSRLFKIPPEPSRLESVLLLGQMDAYAKSLADASGVNLVKMYSANADRGV